MGPSTVVRDKKSTGAAGNSYSAAGDDDINDVAAMGGVNLQEEANVSFFLSLILDPLKGHQKIGEIRPWDVSLGNCYWFLPSTRKLFRETVPLNLGIYTKWSTALIKMYKMLVFFTRFETSLFLGGRSATFTFFSNLVFSIF
jgi:hypothetical protein